MNIKTNGEYIKINLFPSELTQDSAPTPDNPENIHVIKGINVITLSNSDNSKSQNYTINLGSLEYCKIGDYEDQLFKNTTDSPYYDNTLVEGDWYLKKNILKHTFVGDSSVDNYLFNADSTNTLAINLVLNKIDKAVIRVTNIVSLYSNFFSYASNANDNEHLYITGATPITGGYYGNIRLYIAHSRLNGYSSSLTNNEKRDLVKTWLSQNPLVVYCIPVTPQTIHITETDYPVLYQQLEDMYNNAKSYEQETNISQTNDDLPFNIIYQLYRKPEDLKDVISNINEFLRVNL